MNKKEIKDNAYKNLEIINEWINNSDNKTSVALGLIGILLTILFTTRNLFEKITQIISSIFSKIDFSDILFLIIFAISICFFVYGMWSLIKVLIPTLKMKVCNIKSYLFFGSIAQYSSYEQYKNDVLNANIDDVIDDLLNQVYQNSIICNNKYKNFTVGIKYFIIGFVGAIIMYNLGILIYL